MLKNMHPNPSSSESGHTNSTSQFKSILEKAGINLKSNNQTKKVQPGKLRTTKASRFKFADHIVFQSTPKVVVSESTFVPFTDQYGI